MQELDYNRYVGDRGELNFEDDLIAELQKAKWGKVLKTPTEQDLRDNFREIINRRNNTIDKLNGHPLTDYEFQQVMDMIELINRPVDANRFLAGKSVIIKRDNPDDPDHRGKEIFLNIFEPNEITGSTVYQIAEQPIFGTDPSYNARRGDLSLLINGIPVIHIELKAANVDVHEAEVQIEKYAKEGAFKGLYKLVQVFFAMNARKTVYFANPGDHSKFNQAFFFHWTDRENNEINDFRELCNGKDSILSIPNAHQLVGYYTIADKGDNVLKVMRPYQFWAIRSFVRQASNQNWGERHQLGGYFWGTTGCGKTACMYKAGWIIITRNMADKVIYLVDRTELNTQTLEEYRNFSYDGDVVNETTNTKDLLKKLQSNRQNEKLIITSIQKMDRISKDILGASKASLESIQNKRIVFIVDEAHRSEFGQMHNRIKKSFPLALFFGFTGTPIFSENAKYSEVDHADSTTEALFGEALAVYSIADGIRDENVLGFDPCAIKTYEDTDLRKEVAYDRVKTRDDSVIKSNPQLWEEYKRIMSLPMAEYVDKEGNRQKGIEDLLPGQQYNNDKHRRAVVNDIVTHWDDRSFVTHMDENSQKRSVRFHALFATASIPEAIEYYKLFKEHPELKVTALFDANVDNKGSSLSKEDALIEIVDDYNAMFGTAFSRKSDPNFKRFKKDVSRRLAHKNAYAGIEAKEEQCLDILIVVDQMLTGYDSKWINTLYADKVMQSDQLIQAISRTNRIFDKKAKPFGIFRFYRKCYTMKQNLDNALALYCKGDNYVAKIDDVYANIDRVNELLDKAVTLFENNKPDPIFDFFRLPDDEEDCNVFRRIFEEISRRRVAYRAQGYVENTVCTDEDGVDHKLNMTQHTYELMEARYNDLRHRKSGHKKGDPGFGFDLDTYLSNIDINNIDARYLESHFEQLKVTLMALDVTEDERDLALDMLRKDLGILSETDREIAEFIIAGIRDGSIPVEDKSLQEYIDAYKKDQRDRRIARIVNDMGCDEDLLREFLDSADPENINRFGKLTALVESVDIGKVKAYFKTDRGFYARAEVDKYFRSLVEK